MPKKMSIDQEKIIATALAVTIREGLINVTARAVAKEAQCSTQPIYSQFKDIEALKMAVVEKAFERLQEDYMKPFEGEDPFLKMGIGTLRFARELPELYKALFITEPQGLRLTEEFKRRSKTAMIDIAATGKDMEDKSLEVTASIHEKLSIFTHGLAIQLMGDSTRYTDDTLKKLLNEAWDAFEGFYKRNK